MFYAGLLTVRLCFMSDSVSSQHAHSTAAVQTGVGEWVRVHLGVRGKCQPGGTRSVFSTNTATADATTVPKMMMMVAR